jgi:L-threonylcarbamoyladenylate synthase
VITRLLSANCSEDVVEAARLLRAGELVAFPTETVYGLGARADDADALARLYEVKDRPADKKMTILLADPEDARRYAKPLDEQALRLAKAFWPGPLTLVVPSLDVGEVGLRCPDHGAARQMLRLAGVPVAAPSANRSGEPPALDAEGVMRYFDGAIAAVLDGGRVRGGVASTVVRVALGEVHILRAGALTENEIRAALSD